MKVIYFILFYAFSFSLLAQAELEKVRLMFPEPNEDIPVDIWKGQLDDVHAVEFYLGERDDEIKGYYRLVSSGNEFLLEGEKSDKGFTLSEYTTDGTNVGLLFTDDKVVHEKDKSILVRWFNTSQNDLVEINLTAAFFSDYPETAFKPIVKKYSNYSTSEKETYMLELINDGDLIVHHTKGTITNRIKVESTKIQPLVFSLESQNNPIIFEETSDKLRRRTEKGFDFFNLENSLEFRKISYASHDFLCDVDYLVSSNVDFNTWVYDLVKEKRSLVKKEISVTGQDQEDMAGTHFYHKWYGWCAIDYLGDNVISGRMVFIQSWNNLIEEVPFTYDLNQNELITLLDEFKNGFNIEDYVEKYIVSELNKQRLKNPLDFKGVEASDFKYFTLNENNLLISTKYNQEVGFNTLEIPFTELKGLVKRNSILKTIMR